jgi:nicotinate phosphoribosyltransferase
MTYWAYALTPAKWQARKLLDDAGFTRTEILASNSLDEYAISQLKQHGAKISSWGAGTNLATAYDHPALDGVYKLCAIRNKNNDWEYKLKLSEQEVKISNPGRHQVRRFFCEDQYIMDVIYDLDLGISDVPEAVSLDVQMKNIRLDDCDAFVDLLKPIFRHGKLITENADIHETRKQAIAAAEHFVKTHGEEKYSVGLEKNLFELKQKLIQKMR